MPLKAPKRGRRRWASTFENSTMPFVGSVGSADCSARRAHFSNATSPVVSSSVKSAEPLKAPPSLYWICVFAPPGEPLPPAAAMVIVSVPAFVVMVTLAPAASVSVSVPVSATTSDCPETAMVEKVLPPPPGGAAQTPSAFKEIACCRISRAGSRCQTFRAARAVADERVQEGGRLRCRQVFRIARARRRAAFEGRRGHVGELGVADRVGGNGGCAVGNARSRRRNGWGGRSCWRHRRR